jgi:hypothetical protein
MSELGHSGRLVRVPLTSDLAPVTDIFRLHRHVSKVPTTTINARRFDARMCHANLRCVSLIAFYADRCAEAGEAK